MNVQRAVRSSSNGFGRRRGGEVGTRAENKSQSGKLNANRLANAGTKVGGYESSSRDRLMYLATCFIGHHVEVQVKNGSIYSGIFHATNGEKEFGITLRMARMTKDGSLRGQKSVQESVSKALSKILIISANELVQVIAKDVPITRDGSVDEVPGEKQQEILIDSFISQSRQVEVERELEPWVPDEDDPQCPELENIFNGPWNRGWDQFETNEALFGVKSTFDEELYTTKLERGPQTRELEKKAERIAREIEGEETHDLHLAEERGIHVNESFDIDEETRFSSVFRGKMVDDSGYEENEDILLDSHNDETFGDSSDSIIKNPIDWSSGKSNDVARVSSSSCAAVVSQDEAQSSQSNPGLDLNRSDSYDHVGELASESSFKSLYITASESRIQDNLLSEHGGINNGNEFVEKQAVIEDPQCSKSDDSLSSLGGKKDGADKGGLSPNATSYAPSHVSVKDNEKVNPSGDLVEGSITGKAHGQTQNVNSHGRPGSSASCSSECAAAASASSGPGLSPSSSMGSLSSEKSTLNPHAKEFKLNPNAKIFVPSQAPVRPPSPVSDSTYYFSPAVPQMPPMPVGIGIGPSYVPQPVMYNTQVGPIHPPQAYFHPNGPQYGQLVGHPRQVLYMPSYQPEMPYKGRDY
ncbi:polyadenylate-binding protein-interacting protein 4 isoform X1 [Ziziphus jujuba]|uniref:Polyadenylate-binding protein-interacting protein 4 isoform X1 n=1 Tax=Ziziphus jujuba TaxID=326968 RepID=A0A6P3YUJ5_ZIZJJ|nr:polyadenylate-binding protein-interacting protein 4 isoform X1 [Ziziphus jujuba]XP_015865846.3 polyadenylate-binding protein-interacting protein 4 isoform X1 [Ziziphus jujuba]